MAFVVMGFVGVALFGWLFMLGRKSPQPNAMFGLEPVVVPEPILLDELNQEVATLSVEELNEIWNRS